MSKYEQIIEWIFSRNYTPHRVLVPFNRDELARASTALGFARIKNLGDIPYAFRFRRDLPETIQSTAPAGAEWIIVGMGVGEYAFRLASPVTGLCVCFRPGRRNRGYGLRKSKQSWRKKTQGNLTWLSIHFKWF